ncbi:MAG: hypothetical protein OXC28_17050 [Defluviicoccus sp.]|nr:hypothetical protein [Defluviicoccus sp.]
MKRPRRRRKAKFGKHISISARDPEWEVVQRNAKRRDLSIARYVMWLVERDAARETGGEPEGPALALARDEQRELLAAVREIRTRMLEGADAGPLVARMQEHVAIRFNAWVSEMAGSGRLDELRAALGAVLGDERAREVAARIAPSAAVRREAPTAGERDGDEGSGQYDLL